MRRQDEAPSVPSRAEWLGDAAIHAIGVVAAIGAVPVMVTLAALWDGRTGVVLATVIYGLCLIAMLACSALYHMAPLPAWKEFLRRADHSAIYVKIAGTYTPFAVLAGPQAIPVLAGIWSAAAAGVSVRVLRRHSPVWFGVVLYLAMGWLGVLLGQPMIERLSPAGYWLMVAGGLTYTTGVVFFLWERLPFHTAIWHLFVLAATGVFYAAVVVELWSGQATLVESAPVLAAT